MSATQVVMGGRCARVAIVRILLAGVAVWMPQQVTAQSSTSLTTPLSLRKSLNSAADQAIHHTQATWHAKFQALRDGTQLTKFIERFSSFGQKLDNTTMWAEGPKRVQAQMRDFFRDEVCDERLLIAGMKTYASEALQNLRDDDQALARALGRPLGSQESLCDTRITTATWDNVFEPLFRKSAQMSQEATAQSLVLFAGGNLLSDLINDVGRSAGINPFEDGSTGDFLSDLGLNIAVGEALEQAFCPTDRFHRELKEELRQIEHQLLDGPLGLVTQLRAAAAQHQQARQNLVP